MNFFFFLGGGIEDGGRERGILIERKISLLRIVRCHVLCFSTLWYAALCLVLVERAENNTYGQHRFLIASTFHTSHMPMAKAAEPSLAKRLKVYVLLH